jgi:flagellin
MPLNSVNTNIGAQVALQSLNHTSSDLQATQKRISTGFRVADATDDGAAFAIAQRVRSDVGALTTVNQQLGNAKGLVGVANSGLTTISGYVNDAKALLVKIGDASVNATQRSQSIKDYQSLVTRVADSVDGATYNGQSLLGTTGTTSGTATAAAATTVFNNENGATSNISAEDVSGLANTLAGLIGQTFTRTTGGTTTVDAFTGGGTEQTAATDALNGTANGAGDTAATVLTSVSDKLNQVGADSKFLDATITANNSKIDSLNAGLGALIDTDLSKESANLQALQIRQQLGTQALSLANQAPQSLLSLFK